MSLIDAVIGIAVVVAALVVLVAPRLAAAVAFLVFGVLLTALWAVLGAPDIALAEAALGTGVTGALFIEAITRESPARAGRSAWWVAAALVLVSAATVIPMLARVASDTAPDGLGPAVAEALPGSGVDHPVTAVLLAFRAYDTLLEIAILFLAVVITTALGDLATRPDPVPNRLVSPFLRRILPFLVIVAGWFLFAGSALPGGAFQAAALLAGVLLLVRAAGQVRWPRRAIAAGAVVGLLAFLAVAVLGVPLGAWLGLPPAAAGVVIVVLETVLTLSIAVSLALLVSVVGDLSPHQEAT